MLTGAQIKELLSGLGADLCGIASVDRFTDAPEGFHPRDILPECRSVIVFAKRFPKGSLRCGVKSPYTITRNALTAELDAMALKLCTALEEHGIIAVPTGTISHSRNDEKTGRRHGPFSAKHAAVLAGLGRIGRNTLLVTPEFGNMVWLCAVLADAQLQPDEMLSGSPCLDGCSLCADNCPAGALGAPEMNQNACRTHAFRPVADEDFTIKCNTCRAICPNCLGSRNS